MSDGKRFPADFESRMELLRDGCREHIREWSGQLLLLRAGHDLWEGEQVEEILNILHSLSGTGGTFGFTDISMAAGALENLLVAGIRDPFILTPLLDDVIRRGQTLNKTPSP